MTHTLRRSKSKYARTRRQHKKQRRIRGGGGFLDDIGNIGNRIVGTFKPSTPAEKCQATRKAAQEACSKVEGDIEMTEIASDTSPVGEGTAPLGQGTAPLGQGTAPLGQGTASLGQGTAPLGQGTASLGEGPLGEYGASPSTTLVGDGISSSTSSSTTLVGDGISSDAPFSEEDNNDDTTGLIKPLQKIETQQKSQLQPLVEFGGGKKTKKKNKKRSQSRRKKLKSRKHKK
jgi:hypothetical protein